MSRSTPAAAARQERRARIEQAALELFRSRGFDRVTVEDVCVRAGVAPATFYRHFGTKEEVVFAYTEGFTAALDQAVDAAVTLPEEARLPTVLTRFAAFLEAQQDTLALRDEIVLGHPRLLQRTMQVQRDVETALGTRLGALRAGAAFDYRALLEGGIGITVLRVAVRAWRSGAETSLVAATRRALDELRDLVAGLDAGARPEGGGQAGSPLEAQHPEAAVSGIEAGR
jgi:AcrR family transcriptional regulator